MLSGDIQRMVDRFLGWKLPKDFSPDAGISFKPTKPYEGDEFGNSWWPTGTNLFGAEQARTMVEYMLDGQSKTEVNSVAPERSRKPEPVGWTSKHSIVNASEGRMGTYWGNCAGSSPIPLFAHPDPRVAELERQLRVEKEDRLRGTLEKKVAELERKLRVAREALEWANLGNYNYVKDALAEIGEMK